MPLPGAHDLTPSSQEPVKEKSLLRSGTQRGCTHRPGWLRPHTPKPDPAQHTPLQPSTQGTARPHYFCKGKTCMSKQHLPRAPCITLTQKNSGGAGAEARGGEPPLGTPASQQSAGLSPSSSAPDPVSCQCSLGGSRLLKYLDPCPTVRKQQRLDLTPELPLTHTHGACEMLPPASPPPGHFLK